MNYKVWGFHTHRYHKAHAAEPIIIPGLEWIELVVHREVKLYGPIRNRKWVVTERTSGHYIAIAESKSVAISVAIQNIETQGKERTMRAISLAIDAVKRDQERVKEASA